MTLRSGSFSLGLLLAVALPGCASDAHGGPSPGASANHGGNSGSDCAARADAFAAGLSKQSSAGLNFELSSMKPEQPLQSPGPPGNSWTVRITDSNGAPVTGAALNVTSYMPDHGHAGPPTIGVETSDGVYAIDSLVFPMPAFYAVTLTLTPSSGEKQSVAIYLCVEAASG